jgi:hypothetical protein
LQKESLPVHCLAPESLSQNIFNMKTDAYAFGVLMWQIIHFGKNLQLKAKNETYVVVNFVVFHKK